MLSSKVLYIIGASLVGIGGLALYLLLAFAWPYGTPTVLNLANVPPPPIAFPTYTPFPTFKPWPTSTMDNRPTRTPGPTATLEIGLIPAQLIPRHDPSPMQLTGRWRGWVNDKLIEVSAGSEGPSGDPMQGLIAVDVARIFGAPLFPVSDYCCMQIYRTSDRPGALQIRSVDGLFVTLVSADGKSTYVFDLATNTWVDQGSARPPVTPASDSLQRAGMIVYSRFLFESTAMINMIIPRVWVDAGSETSFGDIQQGVLRITHELEGQETYPTPLRAGPIRIVSLGTSTVVVTSLDGQYTFYFDLPSSTWISSNPTPSVLTLP